MPNNDTIFEIRDFSSLNLTPKSGREKARNFFDLWVRCGHKKGGMEIKAGLGQKIRLKITYEDIFDGFIRAAIQLQDIHGPLPVIQMKSEKVTDLCELIYSGSMLHKGYDIWDSTHKESC